MKLKLYLPGSVRLTLAAIVVTLVSACQNNIFGVRGQTFVIQVDSITGPTAVSANASFNLEFWGTIGPNGCYSFKEFKTSRSGSTLDITLYGRSIDGAGYACPQSVARLSGVAYSVSPPVTDPFTVVVHQADNSTLTRVIRAE